MLVFEAKLRGTNEQYKSLDEAIRTARFVRNSCLRYWMDNKEVNKYDLNKYCKVLRDTFDWCKKLSAQARVLQPQNVLGLELLVSTRTASLRNQVRRDILASKSIVLQALLSTRLMAGSCQRTEEKLLFGMV